MMSIWNEYPNSNAHELNLDWIINKVKELSAEWAQTRTDWTNVQAAWEEMKAYVNNYFENLDVQNEINVKLDDMAESGELSPLIAPFVESGLPGVVQLQLPGVVALQIGDTVAAQLPYVVQVQLPDVVATYAAGQVAAWLAEHVNPETGYVIDDTLTIQGAAADAKAVGDAIGELRSALSYISDITGLKTDVTDLFTFTNGYYVNGSTGQKSSASANFSYSGYVNVEGYESIEVTMPVLSVTSTSMGNGFYTSNAQSSYISKSGNIVRYGADEVSYETREFSIPSTAKYFRTSWFADNGSYASLVSNFSCKVKKCGIVQNLSWQDVTGNKVDGYVNADDGEIKGSASYQRTEYVPIVDGLTYYYTGRLAKGTSVGGYNKEGVFVSNVLAPSESTSYTKQELTIPSGVKFIIASHIKSSSLVLTIEASGNIIKSLETQVSNILNDNIESVPLTSVSLFEKVGVLGDSFSSGAIYDIPSATSGAHYGMSWARILGRMEGIDCIPFASPGVNAKDYLTDIRCLPALLNADPCNLYVFLIGINSESVTGTVADINDEDYTQNPDTFCGNMGRIYAQLIVHAPSAKVIFVKPPKGSSARRSAVGDIATHYGCPCFDTLDDIFYHSALYKNNQGNGHPVGVTYAGMAQAMKRQIEKCMCDNISYFLNYTGND